MFFLYSWCTWYRLTRISHLVKFQWDQTEKYSSGGAIRLWLTSVLELHSFKRNNTNISEHLAKQIPSTDWAGHVITLLQASATVKHINRPSQNKTPWGLLCLTCLYLASLGWTAWLAAGPFSFPPSTHDLIWSLRFYLRALLGKGYQRWAEVGRKNVGKKLGEINTTGLGDKLRCNWDKRINAMGPSRGSAAPGIA